MFARLTFVLALTGGTVRAESLYRTQTTVTGQGEDNRLAGFRRCLEDVFIKVSGAQSLEGDPRLNPYKSNTAEFVRAYSYRDQMFGKPKHDEQGTRDRPYDLSVDFEPSKVNEALKELGKQPWLGRRPILGVFVELDQGLRKYVITADGPITDLERAALSSAAARRGLTVVLPPQDSIGELSAVGKALAAEGAEAILNGRLKWDDELLQWKTSWTLRWQGQTRVWASKEVTFDEAFLVGLGTAGQFLAGQ
jgi:hypothetical protein